jgi:hypothetical protein
MITRIDPKEVIIDYTKKDGALGLNNYEVYVKKLTPKDFCDKHFYMWRFTQDIRDKMPNEMTVYDQYSITRDTFQAQFLQARLWNHLMVHNRVFDRRD